MPDGTARYHRLVTSPGGGCSAEEPLSQIRDIRDEWYLAGTSTQPADRTAAESAITRLYAKIGEPAPEFVWVGSPHAAVLAASAGTGGRVSLRSPIQAALRTAMESVHKPSWASVVDSVRDDPAARAWASVWSELGLSPEAALWSATRVSLGDSLEQSLAGTAADALRAAMTDARQEEVVEDALWGQQEAGWIAFHDARRRIGVAGFTEEAAEQLDLWATLARSCGWWWPYRRVCLVSDRPVVVAMQPWPGRDAHRLHCADGPALRFRDGWEVYAWQGVRVPRGFVVSTWSVADILAEPDMDVRQCAITRMGWERFMAEAAFPQVCPNMPEPEDNGTLTLYDVPDQLFGRPSRMLVWIPAGPDHEGRQPLFAIAVPADTADPVEAFDWTDEHDDELQMFTVHLG